MERQTKKTKNQKDKAPPAPAATAAMRVRDGGGGGAAAAAGRRAALLTRGCWPSRRTGGSESAGPGQESPGCHLQGSVEVDWEDGLSEGLAPRPDSRGGGQRGINLRKDYRQKLQLVRCP